jgi:hypothetical protein
MDLPSIGRLLLLAAVVLAVLGVVLMLTPRVPFLGRLPGDLTFGDGQFRVYIPLATGLLISVVATIILNVLLSRR